jgi:hypothetical protein
VSGVQSINPPLYGSEVVSRKVEFHVARAMEVSEDSFYFAPVIFVGVFQVSCKEGYSCLYVPTFSFAKEEELDNCVVECLHLFLQEKLGLQCSVDCEQVIPSW